MMKVYRKVYDKYNADIEGYPIISHQENPVFLKETPELVDILKEARDLLLMCTLLDKSGQCDEMVEKIDKLHL